MSDYVNGIRVEPTTGNVSTALTTRRGRDLWAEAEEAVQCTCGLLAAGYRGSWAISHATLCPVQKRYEALLSEPETPR